MLSSLSRVARPLTRDDVELLLEALRSIWTLVGCRGRDTRSDEVEELGLRLLTALEADDWSECRR